MYCTYDINKDSRNIFIPLCLLYIVCCVGVQTKHTETCRGALIVSFSYFVGNTDTAQALDMAKIYVHQPAYGKRDNVRSVVVLITDGISTRNAEFTVQVKLSSKL